MSQIKVEPPEIIFESVLPGNLYAMTISVRNKSLTAQRIRLSAPKTGLFALNYVPSGVIAPGLDLRAEIECQIPAELTDPNFTDKIVATMGNEQVVIPIRAIKPYANIVFDRNLSLGNILMNQTVMKELYFDNRSHLPGTVKFSISKGSLLKLSSMKLDLLPYGSNENRQCVKIFYEGKELGTVREFIRVSVLGSTEDIIVDVTGQVIQQTLSLVNANKQGILENVVFGNLFFGETKTTEAFLINSGPTSLSFSLKYEDEETEQNQALAVSGAGGNNSADISSTLNPIDPYAKCLTVSPCDGIVKPYSSVPLTMSFLPQYINPAKGFLTQTKKEMYELKAINRVVKVECVDSNQHLSFTLLGNAVLSQVYINPTLLRFGECGVNDRRDVLLSLKNPTNLLIHYEFPTIANFKFDPPKGKILPNETISVIASFVPMQLGIFKTSIFVSIQHQLKQIELKLIGESNTTTIGGGSETNKRTLLGGTDKLPNDFIVNHKFVNPEEETNTRLNKQKLKEQKAYSFDKALRTVMLTNGMNGTNGNDTMIMQEPPDYNALLIQSDYPTPSLIEASQERDEIYGTNGNKHTKATAAAATLNEQCYDLQKAHNQTYNTYLQTSAYTRELQKVAKVRKTLVMKGGIDVSDPAGVNMGMDRGLDEPILHVPKAVEGLWTQSIAQGSGGSGGRLLPFDENRLIQKKYHAIPQTQAELRDCASELTIDELKLVSGSHKLIDFGKVCVGSSSAKNFVVFNGLKKSILINIEELEIEMVGSKALTQIIPDNNMAGFDLYFTSKALGKVKKSFTWKINSFHAYKVHILAEVVPIELHMSKSTLIMEFPNDSLKPTLTSELILTNPGNAYADYLWGSVGAFSCDPERGSIAPGKSTVISITWDPMQSGGGNGNGNNATKRMEEEIGIHITGGIDQVLTVKGILPETKAEFVDKRMNLGVMAVGTEKEIVTKITNTSNAPLVYFLSPLDDNLGIVMDPMEASLLPGEIQEIKVTIIPKVARSYDNIQLIAKIRGGKTIHLRLNGSSIIPTIELLEESFKYGPVVIGNSIRLPFTLRNKSPILANLILELSSFPDFYPVLRSPLEVLDVASKEFGPDVSTQEDEVGNMITLLTSKLAMKINSKNPSYTNSSSNSNSNGDDLNGGKSGKNSGQGVSAKKNKASHSHCWKLSIPANSLLSGELIFRPNNIRKYSFRLPLYLMGVFDDKVLFRDVTAIGIQSILSCSSYVIDFADRVVSRDILSRVPYFLETTITNTSSTGTTMVLKEGKESMQSFDGKDMNESIDNNNASTKKLNNNNNSVMNEPQQIFFISPMKVDLPPGGSTKIRITFQPQHNANYHKELQIYLSNQSSLLTHTTSTTNTSNSTSNSTTNSNISEEIQNRPYLKLYCIGSGVYPRMSFSTTSITLPTVPLNITTRTVVTLYNHGYAALELRHRVSPTIPIPLDISYPDGPNIGIMTDSIRIVIGGKSNTPISFHGKIEFYDNDGERFVITVQGCIDNCILSNNNFIASPAYNTLDYGFIGLDDSAIQYLPMSQIQELRAIEAKRREELRRLRSLERQKAVESKTLALGGGGNMSGNGNKGGNSPVNKVKKSSSVNSIPSKPAGNDTGSVSSTGSIISIFEGIEIDKPISIDESLDCLEAKFILKYFNTSMNSILKSSFDYDRYPYCILDCYGDNLIEVIEGLSGRKLTSLLKPTNSTMNSTNNNTNNSHNNNNNQVSTPGNSERRRASSTIIDAVAAATMMNNQKRASEKSKQIATIDKIVYKYQQILNYLMNQGGLLAHINPITLLNQDEYLLMAEYELMGGGNNTTGQTHLTPAMISNYKQSCQVQWYRNCCHNWLDIIYQCIKLFLFNRIQYKEYITLPGVVLSPPTTTTTTNTTAINNNKPNEQSQGGTGTVKGGKKSNKSEKEYIPKELTSSNVFTNSELILLSWLSYHLEHVENCVDEGAVTNNTSIMGGNADMSSTVSNTSLTTSKRVIDLQKVFLDCFPFCQLIHSHVTDITMRDEPLTGYTLLDRNTRKDDLYAKLEEALTVYHLSFVDPITYDEIFASNRTIMIFIMHLYFLLPHLIPKTKIDFVGMLGLPIMKKIELKNPHKKPILYQVSVKGQGAKEFAFLEQSNATNNTNNTANNTANNTIMITGESMNEFIITLYAKYQQMIKAKIYFWNANHTITGAGGNNTYANGATLCFALQSMIQGIHPIEKIYKTISLYELEHYALSIRNPYPRDVTLTMQLAISYAGQAQSIDDYMKLHYHLTNGTNGSNGNNVMNKKMIKKLLKQTDNYLTIPTTKPTAINDDNDPYTSRNKANGSGIQYITDDWELENLFYQPFWSSEEVLVIPKGSAKVITMHCLPFQVGKYICQMIFREAELGEFAYEIHVDVGLPKSSEKLSLEVFAAGPSYMMGLTCQAKNNMFEKAFNIISEQRIKNANKKIKIRSIFQQLMSSLVKEEDTGASQFMVDCTANFFSSSKKMLLVSEYGKWPIRNNGIGGGNVSSGKAAAANNNANANATTTMIAPSNIKLRKTNRTTFEILTTSNNTHDATTADPTTNTTNNTTDPPAALTDTLNKIIFTFSPEKAGQYKTTAVVYAEDNPHDIRCIDLTIMAKLPDAKMMLCFTGPARKLLTQQIPITNPSNNDWNLNIMTTNAKYFTVPKNLIVPAHQTIPLDITFQSLISGRMDGKLIVKNVENTNDGFEYGLVSEVEEPVAEESLTFACPARKKTVFHVYLPNLEYLTTMNTVVADANKSKNRFDTQSQGSNGTGNGSVIGNEEDRVPVSRSFLVETDLPYTTCPPKVDMFLDSPKFDFVVNSPLGGVLTGYISFQDVLTQATIWYVVTIDVTAPSEEKMISVNTTVRQASMIEILLDNPTNKQIDLTVTLLGDGLIGPTTYTLLPAATNTAQMQQTPYELIYSPLMAGKHYGKISFYHEMVGEIWYKLDLTANPAPSIVLDMMEAMLGSDSSMEAMVENPLSDQIVFSITIEDEEHFKITPTNKLVLSAFQQLPFTVTFRPSSLYDVITSEIILRNNKLGEIIYTVSGRGILPSIMPGITIESPLNEIVSKSIIFRNPFSYPLPLEIFLSSPVISSTSIPSLLPSSLPVPPGQQAAQQAQQQQQQGDVFSLLLRKVSQEIVLSPKQSFHIPIGFAPKALGIYATTLQIRSFVAGGIALLWCYPIEGIAEVGETLRIPNMIVPTKQSIMKDCLLPLVGLTHTGNTNSISLSSFQIDWQVISDTMEGNKKGDSSGNNGNNGTNGNLMTLVSRAFRLQLLELVDLTTANNTTNTTHSNAIPPEEEIPTTTSALAPAEYALKCRLLFEPLREFQCTLDIAILGHQLGKWKAKIDLTASEPSEPDDTIKFTAIVGQQDSVQFKIYNRFLGYSPFQAFFKSHSSPHFSVFPTNGMLPPYDSNGNNGNEGGGVPITLTFAPKEYGYKEMATLNIVTEDAQWTYLLKGGFKDNSSTASMILSNIPSQSQINGNQNSNQNSNQNMRNNISKLYSASSKASLK